MPGFGAIKALDRSQGCDGARKFGSLTPQDWVGVPLQPRIRQDGGDVRGFAGRAGPTENLLFSGIYGRIRFCTPSGKDPMSILG